jgi:ribonuclease HI
MLLRGTRVLARCDDAGEPIAGTDGRVEVRYKPQDTRAYHAAARNLTALRDAALLGDDACAEASTAPASSPKKKAGAKSYVPKEHAADAVIVYADGACSGNPGPAGIGVVLQDGKQRRELSMYLGEGTNNIAELTALLEAAHAIEDKARPVRMHTDSKYAIGVLSQGWKAKANTELIARVKLALKEFSDLEFTYVPGHSGVILNERADALAVQAVKARASAGWITY